MIHRATLRIAIAELRTVEVPKSDDYPLGLKYSLFLVEKRSGRVLVGFDNHRPKGPHMHLRGKELAYEFKNEEQLVDDFWRLVQEFGFDV